MDRSFFLDTVGLPVTPVSVPKTAMIVVAIEPPSEIIPVEPSSEIIPVKTPAWAAAVKTAVAGVVPIDKSGFLPTVSAVKAIMATTMPGVDA